MISPNKLQELVDLARRDHAVVVRPGSRPLVVKNLGWLLRNWKIVESFEIVKDSGSKAVLIALMRSGIFYTVEFASYSVLKGFLHRPVFFGLEVKEGMNSWTIERSKNSSFKVSNLDVRQYVLRSLAALRYAHGIIHAAKELGTPQERATLNINALDSLIESTKDKSWLLTKDQLSLKEKIEVGNIASWIRAH